MTDEVATSLVRERGRDNQSAIHRDLGHRSLNWLGNRVTGRGIRGAVEIQLAPGYVADAMALCSLQMRFHDEWMGWKPLSISLPIDEYRAAVNERMGYPSEFAVVFETKVSRPDFLSTFRVGNGKHDNRHEPIANFHFCVTPKKLITIDELPDWWGLLEASGHGLSLKRLPKYQAMPTGRLEDFAYRLLWKSLAWDSYGGIKICPDCCKHYPQDVPEHLKPKDAAQ